MFKVFLLDLILALHLSDIVFRLYRSVPHYDTLMHFLGGFWVAMMTNYLLQKRKNNVFKNDFFLKIIFIVGAVMIVGFFWELQEFFIDQFIFHKVLITQESITDTMTDLTADFMGAVSYLILQNLKN
jgi:uncharacterized membrane protein YjdF